MLRLFKTIVASTALLFVAQGAQAASMPSPDHTFLPNPITPGSYSITDDLRDEGDDLLWFKFTLGSAANVSLDTLGSLLDFASINELDTVLALYDNSGAILGQSDDCSGSTLTSCLSFSNLGAGMYLAGVGEFDTEFDAMWELIEGEKSDGRVKLNLTVSAVPVPAAVWLFGTALIGFVGMSRRTSVKT